MDLQSAVFGVLALAAATQGFRMLDKQIAALGFQRPYYAVHVVHNAAIMALTAGDVWRVYTDFHNAPFHEVTWSAVILCFALHFYHIIDYHRVFFLDDWLHHGLMIGFALPASMALPGGSLIGTNLFFTTGLPGGISYALLFAQRNGWIIREKEKAFNVPVHTWIRGPGCVATAALILATGLSSASVATWWELTAAILIATVTYLNGVYFTRQVIESGMRPGRSD
jgi:hypothetical protein